MKTATTMGRPKKLHKGGKPVMKKVGVMATEAWVEWLERAAVHCRLDVSKLIDTSVFEYVRSKGFEEPPPARY